MNIKKIYKIKVKFCKFKMKLIIFLKIIYNKNNNRKLLFKTNLIILKKQKVLA